jgi:ectoine hydroxylase-related dioxygenase (phytanoyl-CoA dioxygenase family)
MLSLTQDQRTRFGEDGFLVVERLIDEGTAAALRERFARLFRGDFETGVRPDEVNWQEGTGDPTLTRQICNGWKADRGIARVALDESIGRALAELAGWPGARLVQDNLLWKPPGARALGHHQDNAYLAWYTPREMLSCWIALDDTSAEGGTVEYLLGSHRWARSEAPEGPFHGPADYRAAMERAARAEGIAPEIVPAVVPVVVPAGGGSFHHGWTWHGSGVNRTQRDRRALVVHGASSEARFVPERLGEGNGPIYGRYRRLGDHTMDENHFPVLWTRDGHRTAGLERYVSGG